MTNNTQQTPAGWYADHSTPGLERYWDGQAWGADTRPANSAPQPPAPSTRSAANGKPQANVMGLIALGLAVLGFIFACVPGALVVGWVLLPIAFVLGIIAVFLKGRAKWPAIAAIIVSIVGTIIGVVVFFAVVATAFDNSFGSMGDTSVSDPGTQSDTGAGADTGATDSGGAEVGTRENPAPFGNVVESRDWTVTLTGFNGDATADVMAANQFNTEPTEGQTWVMLEASATYKGEGEGTSFLVEIDYVAPDGTVISSWDSAAAGIEPRFGQANLYAGATDAGKLAFLVPAPADGLIRVKAGMFGDDVFLSLP